MTSGTKAGLWLGELKATLSLVWPMVLTNLAQTLMGATDVYFLGMLGPDALAAGAVGGNIYYLTFFLGLGFVLAVAPVLAKEIGENRHEVRRVRQTVRHGFWLAALMPVPLWAVLWHGEQVLVASGQKPQIAALAGQYLHMLMWANMPYFAYIVLRNFISVFERPRAAMVISLAAIALNAVLNWVFIFGNLGFPAMGIAGSGLATTVASTAMFLALAAYVQIDRRFRRYRLFGRIWRLNAAQFAHLLRLGSSIGMLLLFETALFAVSGLVMGTIGRDSIAAYFVALQFASITFMIPLSLGQAATVRVGLAYGGRDRPGILRAGWVSFWLSNAFMAISALVFLIFPNQLIGIFIDRTDPAAAPVYALAVAFLAYAALFQLVDGAQAVGCGMLRGLQDTRVPLILGGIGYWLIGMPLGLWLAFPIGLEGRGIWLGLAAGLAFVAVTVMWRWVKVTGRLEATATPLA
ncbi:MAG: MATE family efflux transporter [Rhizobiaceae bacterium]